MHKNVCGWPQLLQLLRLVPLRQLQTGPRLVCGGRAYCPPLICAWIHADGMCICALFLHAMMASSVCILCCVSSFESFSQRLLRARMTKQNLYINAARRRHSVCLQNESTWRPPVNSGTNIQDSSSTRHVFRRRRTNH